jgi:hypothetical protein
VNRKRLTSTNAFKDPNKKKKRRERKDRKEREGEDGEEDSAGVSERSDRSDSPRSDRKDTGRTESLALSDMSELPPPLLSPDDLGQGLSPTSALNKKSVTIRNERVESSGSIDSTKVSNLSVPGSPGRGALPGSPGKVPGSPGSPRTSPRGSPRPPPQVWFISSLCLSLSNTICAEIELM